MKKTIAKIMAAAVALSTVVAPNVSAAGTGVGSTGAVWVNTLTFGDANILNGDAGSYAAPVNSGFEITKNATSGNVTTITTDIKLAEKAAYYVSDGGDQLIWYDGTNIVINTSVATVAASVTDILKNTTKSTATKVNDDNVTKVAPTTLNTGLNINSSLTGDDLAAYVIDYLIDNNVVTVKSVADADVKKTAMPVVNTTSTTSKVTVSEDGAFAAENFATANMFSDAAFNNSSQLVLTVNASAENTEKILDAYEKGGVFYAQVTLNFVPNARKLSDGKAIGTRTVYLALTNGSKYDAYVLLRKDNNQLEPVGVNIDESNISTDSGASLGYVTITEADTDYLASDYAKGGRLLLDYVYGWDNGEHKITAGNDFYKIRRIGSRVFKGGKFQQISGLGDDGAQYIRIINNGAFRKCKQLKKVNLDTSKKIRKINAKAFYDCKKLATVKLDGRNLKTIGSNAFKGCKSNITFKIKGNKSQVAKAWKKIKKQAPSKAKYSKI